MQKKGSANVQPNRTANHVRTDSPIVTYGANREFNRWWEHWMSKVPHTRLHAQSPPKSGMTPASHSHEVDEIDEKNAA